MSVASTSPEFTAESASVLIIIPTYDEAQNIEDIVFRSLLHVPNGHVLVVDDGSPDGTGVLADRMAGDDLRVHAIHRKGKLGLGSAYIAGFEWGLARGYEILVQMDADGSHPPETLPELIAALANGNSSVPRVDLVIGSRWIDGGSVMNWPRSRQLLSRGGNLYARMALGIKVRDATAGYRAYRADLLRGIDLSTINSYGYCFQVDLTLRTLAAPSSIVEVPIVFRERERGESKMSRSIVLEAMVKVTIWGGGRRAAQLSGLLRRRRGSAGTREALDIRQVMGTGSTIPPTD
jgi:dolichol-phosphate mannosyltransferase